MTGNLECLNEKCYIYILIDPRTQKAKYVGKAVDPQKRLDEHIARCRTGWSPSKVWISHLLKLGLKPKLGIIDVVSIYHWEEAERHWIATFKKKGIDLLNVSAGGAGNRLPGEFDDAAIRQMKFDAIQHSMPWLPESYCSALLDIVEFRLAWVAMEELIENHGEAANGLHQCDLIEVWERSDMPLATLSPYAAHMIGVKLEEQGSRCVPRWARLGEGWYMPERYGRHSREMPLEYAENIPDKRPEPSVVIDEITEEPVTLFGLLLKRDQRMAKYKAAKGESKKGKKR